MSGRGGDDGAASVAPWLLALHSSADGLGVGLLDEAGNPLRLEVFATGRDLANRLFSCIETVLPARDWPRLRRLAVATGPGGFTSTRLTVVLARTMAQQLGLPLDGVSSFRLIARRLWLGQGRPPEPFWLHQELPRRGQVVARYGADPASPGGLAELVTPRLRPPELLLEGPVRPAEPAIAADLEQLLAFSRDAAKMGAPAPWSHVLPHYPTSPVRQA